MSTLSQLSLKYGTDKNVTGHNYMPMYEAFLTGHVVNSFLEIGLGMGASAWMWREYFPKAKIYIMELFGEEYNKNANPNIPGVDIIAGDATIAEAWNLVPENLDVIVDDGSHRPQDQIDALMLGLKKLRRGGLYFIEDTYNDVEMSDHKILYPWLYELIDNHQFPGEKATKTLAYDFYHNREFMNFPSSEIQSFHIYKNVLLFEKA